MSDYVGGTEPLDRNQVEREVAAPEPAPAEPSPVRDPVAAVKDPDNRAKLLLGLAAISLLNLLLLLIILANVAGADGEPVAVDGKQCIIREMEGRSRLFCSE